MCLLVYRLVDLASTPSTSVGATIGWSEDKAGVWPARARAVLERRPVIIGPLGIPSASCWYLDIETDPLGGTECVWAVSLGHHESNSITQ